MAGAPGAPPVARAPAPRDPLRTRRGGGAWGLRVRARARMSCQAAEDLQGYDFCHQQRLAMPLVRPAFDEAEELRPAVHYRTAVVADGVVRAFDGLALAVDVPVAGTPNAKGVAAHFSRFFPDAAGAGTRFLGGSVVVTLEAGAEGVALLPGEPGPVPDVAMAVRGHAVCVEGREVGALRCPGPACVAVDFRGDHEVRPPCARVRPPPFHRPPGSRPQSVRRGGEGGWGGGGGMDWKGGGG